MAESPPAYGNYPETKSFPSQVEQPQQYYGGPNQPNYGGPNQPNYGGPNQPNYGGPNQSFQSPVVASQPMNTSSSTTVIVNQPTVVHNPPRMWSTGVCSCCDDMGICCMGYFCPCILVCNVASDMGESCCVPLCIPGGVVAMRTKLRLTNNIQGDIFNDGCTAMWCGNCMVCQMAREQKNTTHLRTQTGQVMTAYVT